MVTLLYYSNDLDREYEIDIDFHYKSDCSSYTINGIYERGLNIERALSEFDLTDRVKIKNICAHALQDHYFSEDERVPQSITQDERY